MEPAGSPVAGILRASESADSRKNASNDNYWQPSAHARPVPKPSSPIYGCTRYHFRGVNGVLLYAAPGPPVSAHAFCTRTFSRLTLKILT